MTVSINLLSYFKKSVTLLCVPFPYFFFKSASSLCSSSASWPWWNSAQQSKGGFTSVCRQSEWESQSMPVSDCRKVVLEIEAT